MSQRLNWTAAATRERARRYGTEAHVALYAYRAEWGERVARGEAFPRGYRRLDPAEALRRLLARKPR